MPGKKKQKQKTNSGNGGKEHILDFQMFELYNSDNVKVLDPQFRSTDL